MDRGPVGRLQALARPVLRAANIPPPPPPRRAAKMPHPYLCTTQMTILLPCRGAPVGALCRRKLIGFAGTPKAQEALRKALLTACSKRVGASACCRASRGCDACGCLLRHSA